MDRLSSIDLFDPKLLQNNLNGHDTDIETSDYVLIPFIINFNLLIKLFKQQKYIKVHF